MADKKTNQHTKNTASQKRTKASPKGAKSPAKQTNKSSAQSTKKPNTKDIQSNVRERKKHAPDSVFHQVVTCLYAVLAVVLCVFLAVGKSDGAGSVGNLISDLLYGLFGWGAWLIPVALTVCAFRWKKVVGDGTAASLFITNLIAIVSLSALLHAIILSDNKVEFNPIELFSAQSNGGAIGGLISNVLMESIQKIATYILLSLVSLLFCIFAIGLTPKIILLYIRYKYALARDRAIEQAEQRSKAQQEQQQMLFDGIEQNRQEKKRKKNSVMLDEDELPDGNEADGNESKPFEINMFTHSGKDRESEDTLDPVLDRGDRAIPIEELDLSKVLLTPEQADELPEPTVEDGAFEVIYDGDAKTGANVEHEKGTQAFETVSEKVSLPLEGDPEPKPPKIKPPYRFPPMSLLSHAEPIDDAGAQQELQQNAKKLVDTLLSFKVKTKIQSVSRGPTITRYELSPEAGTRVRSIANLVDDIALNLATSGVRIEAPIPGKSAVGIEVPNKNVATVRLRELVDCFAFKSADSKLNVALGVDVAGTPVYCNLAKMPHMLIAGATGMGKSVCINSIISSILYKANPDEVKLILVDPKKVEFNIYNGLPHLLVPVVSDPQKAAGSLNWAVGEMERRFTKIDEVGVRDINGYNEIIKGNPEYEPMPYVVIIIDELADLMMTAKDTVETSICRLAQKARAAGMHLVIGTQRPSVDVITGLIKANIPSRIAFTVASQVDSKTIIDIGGAEKLIGRGDMLYAPVGIMKPLRVQGAFVSDGEVRAITDFIRNTMGTTEYDSDIISSIEREAERCIQGGKGADDFDGDELRENVDPKFREALEIAVNSGKISTSLLQRHLSIGYGRAAKIIDRMQALGYVSPPEGTKPREVLITKQMYMEKVINNEDF